MSLSHHLLEPGDHGRLGFHPGCPVCRRERLAGALSAEPVVSRRVQAALAACVLAFSTGAPVAAVAAEPDRDEEGVVSPDASGPGDPGRDPDDDPGGDDTDTPSEDEGQAPATAGGDEDGGPVAQPPAPVREPRLVEEPAPPASGTPATPGAQTAPEAQAAPAPSGRPEASPKSAPPKRSTKAKQRRRAPSQPAHQVVRTSPTPSTADRRGSPPHRLAPAPASAPAQRFQSTAARPSNPAGGTAGAPAKVAPGARTYEVRRGDSLWSIAQAVLGTEASPAQIAREVHHLWQLNADAIGTGDPDLIMAGQTLRLG